MLEDVWVEVALGEMEQARSRLDDAPKEHPFDLRYREITKTPWESCSAVLDHRATLEALQRGGSIPLDSTWAPTRSRPKPAAQHKLVHNPSTSLT